MINTKKFDELFSEKEEYSFIKTKEEIETYVCKDNEQNIISLILDFKDFDLYKNSKNIQKVIIYFAIYNNRTKEYLDYTICGTRDFTEQIIISKNHSFLQLLNKFINYNTDISFKFLIVPIINENKKYVFSLEKYFFKPEKLSDNEEIIKIVKNTFSLVLTKLLPLLILVLIPANIYNYLISNLGFIDSLLDISLISRTFVYLLNLLVNNIFTYIICFIIITIISMPICGILTGYINFSFISFMSNIFRKMRTLFCQKNEHEYEILLEKINYKRAIKDTIQLLNILKSLKYYILSSTVSLSFILIYTVFFLFSQIIIANKKDNQQDTFISISAYQYMEYSAFPKVSKIKNKTNNPNEEEKIILLMGYDKAFTYYYDISYIYNLLSHAKKEKIEKFIYENKSKTFQDFFKIFLDKEIKNTNIKAIKNDMYEFINIDNSEIDFNILLNEKRISFVSK